MPKTQAPPKGAPERTKVTMSHNGGPAVDITDAIEGARRGIYTVSPADRPYLKTACTLAQKAAKAAHTACEAAECTQGTHEALTLEGYSDENLLRIDKIVGTELELPTNARLALLTGLRLYGGKLEKLKETEGGLLAPVDGTDDTLFRIGKLLRTFGAQGDLFTEEAEIVDG